ncbi:SDR family NAD(P)-dependent oxidoreductase [Cryobacterium sp. BB307]|uniref:SDR family NAD(P)-dependent oxidoreductase n=1 Tax=Cryobacterium sp. BB307 TaxID=2716317 RepID=UPI0014468FDB|nr:SDR family NAD(P)-dependent oxidoreductase [Cryobacterium sp. BB307]
MVSKTADVVVITGASSGIGRATAHEFAERGVRLVLAARDPEGLDAVVAECTQRGCNAVAKITDVSDETQVQALVDRAVAQFGRIDVWVGAASVYAFGSVEQLPREVFRQLVETNFFGQVYGVRAVLPHMRRVGSGTIILIGSVYSKTTAPYVSAYVASKFATFGFAQSLMHELRSTGISLCMVLPATIDTPIHQHAANATGQVVKPIPPIASPLRVARAIVRLSKRPQPVTVVGSVQGSLIWLQQLAPGTYSRVITAMWHWLGLRGGSVPMSPGTVFEPDPASNQLTGGWRSPLARAGFALGAVAAVALAVGRRRRA